MMGITRRGFFRLAAGAAALAAVPVVAIPSNAPVIWCDGVNDDGPALEALLRGEVVEFRDKSLADVIGWSGDVLRLNGNFTIRSTVIVPKSFSGKTMTGGRYQYNVTCFDLQNAEHCMVTNMHFDGAIARKGSAAIRAGNYALGAS